mmetsp:Transcript_38839/g.79430  ORF Transcript_38839/g.79430 Transcript_38839/m.79430 type:complete len:294 (-) Transcript_38839:404-1285(-)
MLGNLFEVLVELLAVDANQLPVGVGAVAVKSAAVPAVAVATEILVISSTLVVGVNVGSPHHPTTTGVVTVIIAGQIAIPLIVAPRLFFALLPIAVDEAAEHAVGLGPVIPVVARVGVSVAVRLIVGGDAVADAAKVPPRQAAEPLILRRLPLRIGLLGPPDDPVELVLGNELDLVGVGGHGPHLLGRAAPAFRLALRGVCGRFRLLPLLLLLLLLPLLGLGLDLLAEEIASRLPDALILVITVGCRGRRRYCIGRCHRRADGIGRGGCGCTARRYRGSRYGRRGSQGHGGNGC